MKKPTNVAEEFFANDLWHKVCGLIMHKAKIDDMRFTESDVNELGKLDKCVVLSHEDEGRTLRIRMVSMAEGERLMKLYQRGEKNQN